MSTAGNSSQSSVPTGVVATAVTPKVPQRHEEGIPSTAVISPSNVSTTQQGDEIITVGRLVNVASRTWPGINKPGGIARVTFVHYPTEQQQQDLLVDVSYIVGNSREKRVPIKYVKLAPEYEVGYMDQPQQQQHGQQHDTNQCIPVMRSSGLRDRSSILGRCLRCGSLRTDCGSCDWATAEAAEVSRRQQQPTEQQKQQRLRKSDHSKNTRTTTSVVPNDLSSSSSSDDSDDDDDDDEQDDIVLNELFRMSRSNYRSHLKNRRRFHAIFNKGSTTNTTKASSKKIVMGMRDSNPTSTTATKTLASNSSSRSHRILQDNDPVNTSMDALQDGENHAQDDNDENDDSDDDDLVELLEQSQSLFRQHHRMRKKWQRRLDSIQHIVSTSATATTTTTTTTTTTRTTRGKNNNSKTTPSQPSVLETLDVGQRVPADTRSMIHTATTEATVTNTRKRQSTTNEPTHINRSRRITLDSQSSTAQSVGQEEEHHSMDVDDTSVFSTETTSTTSLSLDDGPMPFVDNSDSDDNDDDLAPDEKDDINQAQVKDLQSRVSSYLNDPTQPGLQDDPDDIFIQPEGVEAAESLPVDMVDHTKDVAFVDLPAFFNQTADMVENNLLPDFAFRIARLEREQRRLISPLSPPRRRRRQEQENDGEGLLVSSPATSSNVMTLLRHCSDLYDEMERTLIREGMDQCCLAMKKLSDDKYFKRIRKQLSPEQRKKIRSSLAMDARNLRLDALEDSVKDLVRKLRAVTEKLEEMNSIMVSKNESPVTYEAETADDDLSSNDFECEPSPPESGITTTPTLHPSERELGPFNPHQHASRVRKVSHVTTDVRHESRDAPRGRRTKRSKRSVDGDTMTMKDFIVDDIGPSQRTKNPRLRKPTPFQDGGLDTSQPTSSIAIRTDHGKEDIEQSEASEEEEETQDETPHSSDLFDVHFEQESTKTSNQDSSRHGMETDKRHRQAVSRDSQGSSYLNLHREDWAVRPANRISISRRMQDFLDKNRELGTGDDDDDDITDRVNGNSDQQDFSNREGRWHGHVDSRPQLRRSERTETEPADSSGMSDVNVMEAERLITREYLLSRLESSRGSVQPSASPGLRSDVPHVSLLDQPRHSYPRGAAAASNLLKQAESSIPNARTPCLQQTQRISSELMTYHGRATLLELIVSKNGQLNSHLQLLTTIVKDHPDTIFGGTFDQFLSLVIFQLVDTVYALIHPSGWALKSMDRVEMLKVLEPLRDALTHTVSLTESVCRCIVEQLGCQEWKVSENADFAYVSGFEPSWWRQFVESGEFPVIPNANCESRFHKLGKVWPRVEIETAWNVLCFFGSTQHEKGQAHQARWQIVTKLFSSSVLAKSSDCEKDGTLPPNTAHLKAFEYDIDSFGYLVRKGVLDELPASDTLLVSLLKKAITMQAEDYFGNEESRFRSFPSFGSPRKSKTLSSKLWKHTQSLIEHDFLDCHEDVFVHQLVFHTLRPSVSTEAKNLLMPTSSLFGACLSLAAAWSGRLPKKKVRQARFLKSMKALRESLPEIENALSFIPTEGVSSSNDPFATAFESLRIQVGVARERVSTFMAEVKCNILILESICNVSDPNGTQNANALSRNCGLSQGTMAELWKLVSCDSLEGIRQSLLQGNIGDFAAPSDPMKIFVAGKIMSTAAFLSLGISPWRLKTSETVRTLRLNINADEHNQAIDYYAYPISCTVACVASLSGHGENTHPLCQLLTVITVLFNHLTAIVLGNGTNTTLNRLGAQVASGHLPVLTQCLRRHISRDADSGECQSVCRVILSAIRSVATFQSIRIMKEAAQNEKFMRVASASSGAMTPGAVMDDCFDDLDDSFFASVDTGATSYETSQPPIPREHHWEWIFNALTALTDLNVRPNNIEGGDVFMSTAAKFSLRQEVDRVCDCLLASALAQKADQSKEIWKKLIQLTQPSHPNNIDTDIETKISKRLMLQVCSMTRQFEGCRYVVAENFELFLCGIIRALLDCNRLEAFPSSCISHLMGVGCEGAMHQALAAIDLFSGKIPSRLTNMGAKDMKSILESQRRLRKRVEEPWATIDCLGSALKDNQMHVGSVLQRCDYDLPSAFEPSISSACLEKETFSCFVFLRNIVSSLSKPEAEISMYETISGNFLALLASEMLRVVHGLKYYDLTNQGLTLEKDGGFKRGKIVGLLHRISELFIAVAAWMIRNSRSDASSGWKTIQTHLCDRILFPILRHRAFDIESSLVSFVETCRRQTPRVMVCGPLLSTATTGCSKYFDHCYHSVVRRSHQLAAAPILASVLSSYMIEGIGAAEPNEEAALCEIVGKSFGVSANDSITLYRGPLEEEIDQYLSVVESNIPSKEMDKMTPKRFEVIKCVVIPKLSQKADFRSKRTVLRIASHMFAEQHGFIGNGMYDSDLLGMVASFVRVMLRTLFQCLRMSCVDHELVSVVFSCSGRLAALETADTFEDPKAMLSFCDDEIAQMDLSDPSILCDSELRALYVHTFFRWMFYFSGKLSRSTAMSDDVLSALRQLYSPQRFEQSDDFIVQDFISSPHDAADLAMWTSGLIFIEDKLFGSKSENIRPVVNMYAKTSTVVDTGGEGDEGGERLEAWKPSSFVCRSAMEYMTTIVSLSS